MNQELSPNDPRFWNRPTPVNCDTVRLMGILLCIAAFVGVFLNGALVYSFLRYKALRSPHTIYFLFIAFMGLIASCTILPLTGTSSIYCQWLYKRIGCQLSAMIAFLYGCSSIYLLCAVSVARCYSIIRPFNASKMTVTRSVIISCFVVLLAFIMAMFPFLGWNEYVMEGVRTSCCINWYDRRLSFVSFTFFLFIFVYCIPLLIIIVSNTITLVGLKRMREKIKHGLHTAMNRKRIEMERRIVRSIIITTCGFLFTWTPYAITLFISAFRGKDDAIPSLVTFYCACFAKSSAIWLPMLYMGTSTQFQLRFITPNAFNTPKESNDAVQPTLHKLVIVHNYDGSIIVRTVDKISEKGKLSSTNSNMIPA